ncbi:MAG: hypothetical protein U1F43_27010 [Myxococcota bacterium]
MDALRTVLVAGLALAAGSDATALARGWDEGPQRLDFEVGVDGLIGFDEAIDDQQWGGAVTLRARRWGPLTLELSVFGLGGASGDPRFGGPLPEAYMLLGVVPGIGIEVGRGPREFGVGLFCRPPVIAVLPDHGDDVVRTPALQRSFFRLPNITIQLGDDHNWIEMGGGGDPTPLDPRLGFVSYNWRASGPGGADEGGGGSAGLGVMGVIQGDGAVATSDLGLSFHLDGWIPIGEGVLMGLRGDVSSVVSLGLTFAYRLADGPRFP